MAPHALGFCSEFEPCDTKPHINADVSVSGETYLHYDISNGMHGEVPIPGVSQ